TPTGPSPNTVCVAFLYSGQRVQDFASRATLASFAADGLFGITGLSHELHQGQRILGRLQLVSVGEVKEDVTWPAAGLLGMDEVAVGHRPALAPRFHARRPAPECRATVGTLVELGRAVQAHVDKVRSDIHQERPFDRVGANQGDIVLAQELDEGGIAEALVPDLHGMANPAPAVAAQPCPALQAMVVMASTGGGLLGVARQQPEEGFELLRVEAEVGRELPEDRAELGAEPQRT